MVLTIIVREKEISIAEEISQLYDEGESPDYLVEWLLYNRQWCDENGIRYYDLHSFIHGKSACKIAQSFIVNSIFKDSYTPKYKQN